MGCGSSSPVDPITPPVSAACTVIESGSTDKFKASRLYVPFDVDKAGEPLPAIITVHGAVAERSDTMMGRAIFEIDWKYMDSLSEILASKLGVVVLMIGMPDDDEAYINGFVPDAIENSGISLMLKLIAKPIATHFTNTWAACKYSESLSAAIDHLCATCPEKAGVRIDEKKIALCGHSMGGGGVLFAAGVHCKERLAACVALNPSHGSVDRPFDNIEQCIQAGKGADHSGEYGEGTIAHLSEITCPTLIYGSQAEYNVKGPFGVAIWPTYDSLFEQLTSAASKELFVDSLTQLSYIEAHEWLVPSSGLKIPLTEHNEGIPLEVVCSFIRRHVCGSDEAPPDRPNKDVKSWVGGAPKAKGEVVA